MRRQLSFRVSALFAALWIAVALVEPPGMHACPMHNPDVSQVAGDGGAHGHHAPAEPDDNGGHGAHHCLCLGDCAGATTGLAAVPETVVAATPVPAAVPLQAPPAHAPFTRGGLVLPFANGPPRVS
jgi:hypothetical protein